MFVADENVESAIVFRLRADGHDVIWIAEAEPGVTDDRVLALAAGQDRVLITGDTDFGELVFRQRRTEAGVMLIRLVALHQTARRRSSRRSSVLTARSFRVPSP